MPRREFCLGLSASLSMHALGGSGIIRNFARYSWSDYENDLSLHGRAETWSRICRYLIGHGESKSGILRIANFPKMYEYALARTSSGDYGRCAFSKELCNLLMLKFRGVRGSRACFVNAGVGDLVGMCLSASDAKSCQLFDDDAIEACICRDVILTTQQQTCEIVDALDFSNNTRVLSVLPNCLREGRKRDVEFLFKLIQSDCASVTLCSYQLLSDVDLAAAKRDLQVMTISAHAAYEDFSIPSCHWAVLTIEGRV